MTLLVTKLVQFEPQVTTQIMMIETAINFPKVQIKYSEVFEERVVKIGLYKAEVSRGPCRPCINSVSDTLVRLIHSPWTSVSVIHSDTRKIDTLPPDECISDTL